MPHPARLALLCLALVLTLGTTAFAEGVAVDQATEDQKAAAQKAFTDARKAFDERRFVDALRGFRASFDIVASPNTHLMITHSLRELERNAEAYDELGAVIARAEAAAASDARYAEAAQLAREQRDELRPSIALLTLEIHGASAEAKLTVGGRLVPAAAWGSPIAVDPGAVTVVLRDEAGTVAREVAATAGGEAKVSLSLEASEPPPPPTPTPTQPESAGWQWGGTQRIVAYTVTGVGVAALVASAVTGALAQSQYDELVDACGDVPCPEREDDIASGELLQTVSNVTLVAGLVAVAGGVVLFFTAPDEEPAEGTALRLGPGSLTLQGRFW